MINREYHSWVELDTQDNAAATATRAAPSGGISHYVTSVSGSYSASVAGATLILSEGSTEIARWHVYDAFGLVFPSPIYIAPGNAVNLELAASGGAGNNGSVVMTGYTA